MSGGVAALLFCPTLEMRAIARQSAAHESRRLRENWERSQFGGLTLDEANAEYARSARHPIDWNGLRALGLIGDRR